MLYHVSDSVIHLTVNFCFKKIKSVNFKIIIGALLQTVTYEQDFS